MTQTNSSAGETLGNLSHSKAELLKLLLEQKSRGAQTIEVLPRAPGSEKTLLPTSWAQQRLWFIDEMEGSSAGYNIPFAIRLRGALEESSLRHALNSLAHRHETLRTAFVNLNGDPHQQISPSGHFSLTVVDLSDYPDHERQTKLRQHQVTEAHEPFDLKSGSLARARLIRLRPQEHVLLVTLHHIIADGWSLGVFFRELGELYSAHRAGRAPSLEPLRIQYADYAAWQRKDSQGEAVERQLRYWCETLRGAAPLLELPTDHPRPSAQSYSGENMAFAVDANLSERLNAFARQHDLTLFVVLYAAWALLMAKLSGQEDICIGTPIANRQRPEVEGLIGFFANTLVLRTHVAADQSLSSFLEQARRVTRGAYDHQDVPFERVVEALQPERSLNRNPLFQVMFALQTAPRGELALPGVTTTLESGVDEPAIFDLFVSLEARTEGVAGYISYATDLFDRVTIGRWLTSYTVLLEDLVRADESRTLAELSILSDAERHEVTRAFNHTAVDLPHNRTVHELVEEQVSRTPTAVALVHGNSELTYEALNSKANRLARYLVSKGVEPDQPVGICLERGLDMVVGLLAILKAGGAYLPLDPHYPVERLQHMLEDAKPSILLTQDHLSTLLPSTKAQVLVLDSLSRELEAQPDGNLPADARGINPGHLLYVIYTSGSTGRPKGTAMPHRSIVNLIEWHRRTFGPGHGRRVLQFAALSFDVACQETFSTLCTGGTLVMLDEWVRRDAQALYDLLDTQHVHRLFVPPLMLQSLAEHCLARGSAPVELKDVITAGEQLRVSAEIASLFRRLKGARLHNHYGPTETHVVTALTLSGDPAAWPALPSIGQPIANARIYILDPRGQPVPLGVTGEIFIGGAGVARGYLHQPALTRTRFVPDLFSGEAEARLYKTGDLGRWRPDGTIEYLGRNDDQVKLRGFRIELGEIEARLRLYPEVKEVAVIAREDRPGEKRLVAYLVPRASRTLSLEALRLHLQGALPDHMVPSAFVSLPALPLSPNGKLDRRALPPPGAEAYIARQYEEPQGSTEIALAGIWQQLLHVERVGRQDNFFQLGGHSLLIVQMKERLRRIGWSVSVRSVYEKPTLAGVASTVTAELSAHVEAPPNLIEAGGGPITPRMLPLVELTREQIERIAQAVPGGEANIQDIYPLAPLQEGLLFHHLLNEKGDVYIVTTLLQLASREKLDALISALQNVIDRYDILRTAVLWEQLPQPVQVVYRSARLPVHPITFAPDQDPLEQLQEWTKPEHQRLELRKAPLMALQTAHDPRRDQWYALLQMHHLTHDHDAMETLFAEVLASLEGKAEGLPQPVPYRHHIWQALQHARTHDPQPFFRRKLGDITEPTAPFGLLDVHGDGTRLLHVDRVLEPSLSDRLRACARRFEVTAATLFHAAWARVVSLTSGRDDVVFGTLLSGRFQGSAGSQRMLGMFINTLPLRVSLQGATVRELIEQTHRELIDLLTHEQASLAVAQRCSAIVGNAPLFSALLNYRHSVLDLGAEFGVAGLRLLGIQGLTNYPVTLSVDDRAPDFLLDIETDVRVDPKRMMDYTVAALTTLVDALEKDPDTPAQQLSILSELEQQRLTTGFNRTAAPFPRDRMIHQLFEDQVRKTPRAVAAIHYDQTVTYQDLNRKANQLARYLVNAGVSPDQPVGICAERGLEMLVGLLAIVKAGGAYLPLDPNYPAERLEYMLHDAAPRVILVQDHLRALLPNTGAETISLGTRLREVVTHIAEDLPTSDLGLTPDRLLYVIYTSGSTGRPKGTAMPHRAIVNLIEWHRSQFAQFEGQRVLQFAALSFDVACQETFSTLCTGGTLVLLDEWVRRDAQALVKLLKDQHIHRLFVPPLLLQSLAEYAVSSRTIPQDLRDVTTAGEALRISPEIRALFRELPGARLHNHYGPTETHVVTSLTLSGAPEQWPTLPTIGRPIANTQIYILDRQRLPAPLEVPGEIYIGGTGVARGYLGRPELTQERFIPDPYSHDGEGRLYRTGDLGRWRPDGTIEYLGRNDDQIKLRGYRIELGEIEAQLVQHPSVKEAAVVAREDASGEKRLVAYIVSRGSLELDLETLRVNLQGVLPDYMIPSAWVPLPALPLSPNGKLDRHALPRPEADATTGDHYEAPEGEIETALATMWQQLLHVQRVGRQDDFFALGGHSLHAMRMSVRIGERFGMALPVSALYKHPRLEQLADLVATRAPATSKLQQGGI